MLVLNILIICHVYRFLWALIYTVGVSCNVCVFIIYFFSLHSFTFSPSGWERRESKAKSKPVHSNTAWGIWVHPCGSKSSLYLWYLTCPEMLLLLASADMCISCFWKGLFEKNSSKKQPFPRVYTLITVWFTCRKNNCRAFWSQDSSIYLNFKK